jgi:AcrR family transcriptional regulator
MAPITKAERSSGLRTEVAPEISSATNGDVDGLARELLSAARAAFIELGYQRASVARIAEEADTSVGLVYYHFRNKAGLFQAVLDEFRAQELRNTRDAVKLMRSVGVTDGRQLLLAGARAWLLTCWENRDVVSMTLNRDMPPGYDKEERQRRAEWFAGNERLLSGVDEQVRTLIVEVASEAIGGARRSVISCDRRDQAEVMIDLTISLVARMLDLEHVHDPDNV